MESKLEQAIGEAKRIAQDANDFLCGKNGDTVYEDPGMVLACIQGRAEQLAFMLGNEAQHPDLSHPQASGYSIRESLFVRL